MGKVQEIDRYSVILADPPWQYNNSGISGAASRHYPCMSDTEICALPVTERAATDSLLLLWATWPKLDIALEVIQSWGFRYKTGFPWIKLRDVPTIDLFGNLALYPAPGQGWWIRGVTEALLIAVRGDMQPPAIPPDGILTDEGPNGIISLRFRHSKKPANVYEYAELFPGPYLELFARETRPGWNVWGNEVCSDIELRVMYSNL